MYCTKCKSKFIKEHSFASEGLVIWWWIFLKKGDKHAFTILSTIAVAACTLHACNIKYPRRDIYVSLCLEISLLVYLCLFMSRDISSRIFIIYVTSAWYTDNYQGFLLVNTLEVSKFLGLIFSMIGLYHQSCVKKTE